jgi:hypothetical protein
MSEPVTTLLGFFLSTAAAFGKLVGWLSSEDRKTRERVATYFDQIAACMREVAERMEAGDPPRDTCRRLAVYANELNYLLDKDPDFVASGDVSVEVTRERLVIEIKQVHDLWMGTEEVVKHKEVDRKEFVKQLMDAAQGDRPAPIRDDDWFTPTLFTTRSEEDHQTYRLERELTLYKQFNGSLQQVWDAAGEFAALADTLRAR